MDIKTIFNKDYSKFILLSYINRIYNKLVSFFIYFDLK